MPTEYLQLVTTKYLQSFVEYVQPAANHFQSSSSSSSKCLQSASSTFQPRAIQTRTHSIQSGNFDFQPRTNTRPESCASGPKWNADAVRSPATNIVPGTCQHHVGKLMF